MNRATDGPDLLKEVIQEMHVFLQPLNGNSSDKEYLSAAWHTQILGLKALHQQILSLLGPTYSQFYFFSP